MVWEGGDLGTFWNISVGNNYCKGLIFGQVTTEGLFFVRVHGYWVAKDDGL